MANIQADTSAIHVAANNFSTDALNLADLISKVKKDIDDLEGLWTGSAHQAFVDLMTEWNTGSNEIHQVLDAVAQKVRDAGDGYEGLESQITRAFSM